jgi:hypothetical protein
VSTDDGNRGHAQLALRSDQRSPGAAVRIGIAITGAGV